MNDNISHKNFNKLNAQLDQTCFKDTKRLYLTMIKINSLIR